MPSKKNNAFYNFLNRDDRSVIYKHINDNNMKELNNIDSLLMKRQ